MDKEIITQSKNKDDLTEAVRGLDIFCKNFCMNVKETEEKNDLVFRCKECPFAAEREDLHEFPMEYFGSMGSL